MTLETFNEYGSFMIDMPEDTVWSWDSFLASNGLRDAWSTDIELPRTANNCRALGISGMLDQFQDRVQRGILHIAGHTLEVDIVLASLAENISITLYERILPKEVMGKSLKDFFEDDYATIYDWNKYSRSEDSTVFQYYTMGVPDGDIAMFHPCMRLNTMIQQINWDNNINLPMGDPGWYAISTGKNVCPQNQRQVIEFIRDGKDWTFRGGQHVINSLSWNGTEEIVFDRGSRARIKAWLSYDKKDTVTTGSFWMLSYDYDNTYTNAPTQAKIISIPSQTYANGVVYEEWEWHLLAPGTMKFHVEDPDKYKLLEVLLVIDYWDYDIAEDEDTDELEYIPRRPGLHIASNQTTGTGDNKRIQYKINGNLENYDGTIYEDDDLDHDYRFFEWNGDIIGYYYNRTGHPTEHLYSSFYTYKQSFAHFGYYYNLPDITIRDLMYMLGWCLGKKIIWKDGELVFADLEQASIEGEVETVSMNDTLGQSTRIKLQGGVIDIVQEDNSRLELEANWYDCPLAYMWWVNNIIGKLPMYSNAEKDPEADPQWSCDYEQPEGFALMQTNSTNRFLQRIEPLYKLNGDLENLRNMISTKVRVKQHVEALPDTLDFITIHGHDILVTSGEIQDGEIIYEGMLLDKRWNDETQTYQYDPAPQPDNPDEPSFPDDPDEPDDPWHEPDDPNDPDNPDYPYDDHDDPYGN